MKSLFSILILFCLNCGCGTDRLSSESNSISAEDVAFFKKINYSSIKVYSFNCDQVREELDFLSSILEGNNISNKADFPGRTLQKKSIDKLFKSIMNANNYQNLDYSCYTPRMGFVFYKGKKPVASLDVCLECNRLSFKNSSQSKVFENSFNEKMVKELRRICNDNKLECCNTE